MEKNNPNKISLENIANNIILINQILLDRPIDFIAIESIVKEYGHKHRIYNKIKEGLSTKKINSYRDLVDYIKKKLNCGNCIIVNNIMDIGLPNVGTKSLVILYEHLNSIGIKLFDDYYSQNELGEKR